MSIIFLTQESHRFTHQALTGPFSKVDVRVRDYQWLLNKSRLPKGCYVFTDRERMAPWELRVYAEIYRHINRSGPAYRAINDPARMLNRYALLRALHEEGINDFNVYQLTERQMPQRWPVFLRREYSHGQPLTGLLQNQREYDLAVEKLVQQGEPLDAVIAIEYCAEPISGDLFRKLSAYRVGERILFYICVHEKSWLVKYGTQNSASDELYQQEQRMVLDNAFEKEMKRVFEIGGIDYGRADFGLVNGRVQIYEINTNPDTRPAKKEHPNPVRNRTLQISWEKYITALSALDDTDPSGPHAARFDYKREIRKYYLKHFVKRFVNINVLRS